MPMPMLLKSGLSNEAACVRLCGFLKQMLAPVEEEDYVDKKLPNIRV